MAEDVAVPLHDAPLPGRLGEKLRGALGEPEAGIRDDQPDAGQAASRARGKIAKSYQRHGPSAPGLGNARGNRSGVSLGLARFQLVLGCCRHWRILRCRLGRWRLELQPRLSGNSDEFIVTKLDGLAELANIRGRETRRLAIGHDPGGARPP